MMAAIGEFGKYQRKIFIMLCLVSIPFSIFETGPIFWAFTPEYQCDIPEHLASGKSVKNLNTNLQNGSFANQGQSDKYRSWVEELFWDTNDDKCHLHGRTEMDNSDGGQLEGSYCANYTFKDAERTSIVSRVSKVLIHRVPHIRCHYPCESVHPSLYGLVKTV